MPIASAATATSTPLVAALYPTDPRPSVAGLLPERTTNVSSAPTTAPTSCAPMYAAAVDQSTFFVAASAMVTAGLM